MQSYNDFTVGGSLSVNVHGRDPLGSLIKTVISLKILLANGIIVEASRTNHSDLFYAAIGGYGLVGQIVEVTLQLTDNIPIQRVVKTMGIKDYKQYFFEHIYNNDQVSFHNANIYPNDYDIVTVITWYKTNDSVTITDRLQSQNFYLKDKNRRTTPTSIRSCKKIRKKIEPKKLQSPEIVWRNYEMSYSVKSLEPIVRWPSTSIL